MPKARPRLTTAVAASAASLMLLTACGGDSDSDSTSDSTSSADSSKGAEKDSDTESEKDPGTLAEPSAKDTKKVEDIKVTEAKGKKGPSIKVADTPVSVSETTLNVLDEGDGQEIDDDAYVEVDMAMFSGKTGQALEGSDTYPETPVVLDLGNAEALPGLVKTLRGRNIGGTGVAVMPPKDLFGEEGMPEYGIDGKDNLVLVYDVRGVMPPQAEGSKVTPKADLPKVDWKDDAPAEFTVPKGEKAPKKLITEKLIEGTGQTIKKGETVYVTYTGATWDDGKVFDSSMQDGRGPFAFEVGSQQVIPGWDKALEGAKVGDRLLLVVPPKEGYGKEGTPDGSIKGNSTLVFTVDVLGAP